MCAVGIRTDWVLRKQMETGLGIHACRKEEKSMGSGEEGMGNLGNSARNFGANITYQNILL